MNKTTKADWLTLYLYGKKFWVGGTKVTYKENPLTVATQTIRYFHASRSEFLVVYILEFIEPLDSKQDYESAIRFYLTELLVEPNFTLAIWPNQTHSFAVLNGAEYRQNLDTKTVLLTFENFDNWKIPILKANQSFFYRFLSFMGKAKYEGISE